jgi:Glycosyl transferase family 2
MQARKAECSSARSIDPPQAVWHPPDHTTSLRYGPLQPQVARRMYASIILPTYTERENVGQMVEALRRVFGDRQDWEVVIVVDDSPDDT